MGDWYNWLNNTRFEGFNKLQVDASIQWLNNIRDIILYNSKIKKTDTVIDIGTGTGLLGLKILEAQQGEGNVIFLDKDKECISVCKNEIDKLNITTGYQLEVSDCTDLKFPDNCIDTAVMRSVLVHINDKLKCLSEIHRILKKNGNFLGFEPLISMNTRYWELLNPEKTSNYEIFKNIENQIMNDKDESIFNYNMDTINSLITNAGFTKIDVKKLDIPIELLPDENLIDNWFESIPAPGKHSLKERFLLYADEKEFNNYIKDIKSQLIGKKLNITSAFVLINAVK